MQLKQPYETYGHSFDERTGLYLLPVRIFPEADGACPLPDNTVDFPPTQKLEPHQIWRIDAARLAWEVVVDFRGVMLWDKADVHPVANTLGIGELPGPEVTLRAPPVIEPGQALRNRWDETRNDWVQDPDYSQRPLWVKASGHLASPLATGLPLPDALTTLAPPLQGGPWCFNEAQGRWEAQPLDAGNSTTGTTGVV